MRLLLLLSLLPPLSLLVGEVRLGSYHRMDLEFAMECILVLVRIAPAHFAQHCHIDQALGLVRSVEAAANLIVDMGLDA